MFFWVFFFPVDFVPRQDQPHFLNPTHTVVISSNVYYIGEIRGLWCGCSSSKFGALYWTPIKWFKTPSNFDQLSFISSDILLPEPVSLQVELLLLEP